MVSSKLVVTIPEGLHLRPITKLCNRSILFKSSVSIQINTKTVNAKSVLGLLSAGIRYGDEIELICDGEDEKEALQVLRDMLAIELNNGFSKK